MANEMSWDQLQGWMTYAQLEPFGEERGDIRASLVGTTICNVIGRANGMKKDLFKPMDLVPKLGTGGGGSAKPRKPMTSAAEWSSFKQMMATNYSAKV